MFTRRDFISHTAAVAVGGLGLISIAKASGGQQKRAARPTAVAIKSINLRDETIARHGGNGDIFPLTWMPDGRQFGSFSDGYGWSPEAKKGYNTRALWIDGDPVKATFHEADVYPDPTPKDGNKNPPYYGFSTLAVGDRIYQILCCMKEPSDSGRPWNGVKLIYSPDQGRTWCNQDGSTPVVWESYADRCRQNMLFLDEPQDCFSLISLLQMGQNYEANRDGYVYGYGTNGNTDGTMNELVMFRVPKGRTPDRGACEFFGGMKGSATWVKDIRERAVVHTFPRGWVNTPRKDENVVQAWVPSVAYNAPLGLYLMASSGVGCHSDGDWFGSSKPSYLGFWTARNPWGPWTQIHEEMQWTPGNDTAARCYSPQIAPKWIAADGKSFWLVWSDFQSKCNAPGEGQRLEEEGKKITDSQERMRFEVKTARRCMPYYAFNTQRVDLTLKA